MFATALFPLHPPSGSLLPLLSQPQSEPTQQSHSYHSQSRRKPTNRHNTPLTILSHDERLIASRKLAIAMYGYSWLKPAGCGKTMLGRREEELEREEVERQLREVELQERIAMEQEEQERREELRRQADGGEVEGVGERDLDDGIPDADDGEGEESDEDVEDEEDMDGDLDDEVPDADADGQESSWVYDTRRERDTESEEENSEEDSQNRLQPRLQHPRHVAYTGQDDSAATEAMVNAMLDEDEIGEYEHQHDLDDDVPDMDADMDMDANLSDAVPSAPGSPGWEHTDSELEESDMDISLLPPHPSSRSRNPGTTHEEMRRVSGNRMLPPALPPTGSSTRGSGIERQGQEQRLPPPRTAPRRTLRTMMRTPATADDVSALISTGGTSAIDTGPAAEDSVEPRSPNRRGWLNPSGARRNLFSGLRGNLTATLGGGPNQAQPQSQVSSLQTQGQIPARTTTQGVSSGGLFTPSPRVANTSNSDDEEQIRRPEEPRSRTRSGRLLGGLQVGVERRLRRRDGETARRDS